MSWTDQALCRGRGSTPEYNFFPTGPGYAGATKVTKRARAALELCMTCPVRCECFEYGMEINGVGIWGGEVFDNSRRFRMLRRRWLEEHG